jgi:hypothetical protein
LHQHQREVKVAQHARGELAYIEATRDDIALANQVAHEVLGRTLDELPPQTRKLLLLMRTWVREQCQAKKLLQTQLRFTRRQLREAVSWGDTQLKVHLARLVELEYVAIHRRPLAWEYELLYDAQGEETGAHVNGLLDVDELARGHAYDASRSGLEAARSGSGRPSVGARSAGGRAGVNAAPGRASAGAAADAQAAKNKTPIQADPDPSLAAVVDADA